MDSTIKDIINRQYKYSSSTIKTFNDDTEKEFWRDCVLELLKAGFHPTKATKEANSIIEQYKGKMRLDDGKKY